MIRMHILFFSTLISSQVMAGISTTDAGGESIRKHLGITALQVEFRFPRIAQAIYLLLSRYLKVQRVFIGLILKRHVA